MGYVVQFANTPQYKGLDAYLLADWEGSTASLCHSLETATVFHDRGQARFWAEKHVGLATKGHEVPEVLPVWQESRRTLSDPRSLVDQLASSLDGQKSFIEKVQGMCKAAGRPAAERPTGTGPVPGREELTVTNDELTRVLKVGSTVRTADGRLCLVEALLVEGDDRHAIRLKEVATQKVIECGAADVAAVVTTGGEAAPEAVARGLGEKK